MGHARNVSIYLMASTALVVRAVMDIRPLRIIRNMCQNVIHMMIVTLMRHFVMMANVIHARRVNIVKMVSTALVAHAVMDTQRWKKDLAKMRLMRDYSRSDHCMLRPRQRKKMIFQSVRRRRRNIEK